jgi:hypothetical protein
MLLGYKCEAEALQILYMEAMEKYIDRYTSFSLYHVIFMN